MLLSPAGLREVAVPACDGRLGFRARAAAAALRAPSPPCGDVGANPRSPPRARSGEGCRLTFGSVRAKPVAFQFIFFSLPSCVCFA